MSTTDVTLQGLRVSSETTERGDRLDSRVTESVRSAQFLGQNLKDLVLEAEVKGLHTASVQTLSKVFSESCGLQNATADEKLQMRTALKKLLLAGFSVGIPKLQGSGNEGGLDGNLVLTLAPRRATRCCSPASSPAAGTSISRASSCSLSKRHSPCPPGT